MINWKEFIDYVLSFYGEGGLYDFGASEVDVLVALAERITAAGEGLPFEGDSIDRELVRDIMLKNRGLEPWGI